MSKVEINKLHIKEEKLDFPEQNYFDEGPSMEPDCGNFLVNIHYCIVILIKFWRKLYYRSIKKS